MPRVRHFKIVLEKIPFNNPIFYVSIFPVYALAREASAYAHIKNSWFFVFEDLFEHIRHMPECRIGLNHNAKDNANPVSAPIDSP
jgi:hypothetical protein